MPIEGCASCGGYASEGTLEVMEMIRSAQTQQTRVAETLAVQNIALQIDATAEEGIAENIDISA